MRVGASLGRVACRRLWTEAAARLRCLEEGHPLWKAVEQRLGTREVDEALAVVYDMRKHGYYPSQSLVDRLAHEWLEQKRWDATLKLVRREGVPVSPSTYQLVMKACADAGQLDKVLELLHDMKSGTGLGADLACYEVALSACADAADWKAAAQLREELARLGENSDGFALEHLVRAMARAGEVNKALGVLQGAVNPLSPSRVQASILEGCLTGPLGMDGALETAELMRRRGLLIEDDTSGEDAGTMLLAACKRQGRMEDAASLVRSIASPTARHYAMAISACAPGGHGDVADELYKEMSDRGVEADPVVCLELMDVWSRSSAAGQPPYCEKAVHFATSDTTPQDIRIYNAAMLACLRARAFDSVLHLWRTLQHREIKAWESTCSYVIRACLHSGRWQEALKVVHGLKDSQDRLLLLRRRPNSLSSRVELVQEVFLVGLTTLAREGEWAALLDLMHDMKQLKLQPDEGLARACNYAISCCVRDRHWAKAVELYTVMRDARIRPDLVTGNAIMKALAELGQPDAALRVLDGMIQTGLSPDEVSFSTAIHACGRAGQWQKALSLLHAMEANQLPVNEVAVSAAIDACMRAGQLEQALALCSELTNPPAGGGGAPSAVLLNVMVTLCGRAGDHQRAKLLLEEMRGRGLEVDVAAYTSAMRSFGATGNLHEALEVFRSMDQRDEVSYTAAIDVCQRNGRLDAALQLLDEMQADGISPSPLTYKSVIYGCAQAGDWSRAVELLRHMRDHCGASPDELTYTTVVNACAAAEQVDLAVGLLDEMIEQGLQANAAAFFSTVRACRHLGQWRRCLSLLAMLEAAGVPPISAVYQVALESCIEANQPEQAAAVLRQMISLYLSPDVATVTKVLESLSSRRSGVEASAARRQVLELVEDAAAADIWPGRAVLKSCASLVMWPVLSQAVDRGYLRSKASQAAALPPMHRPVSSSSGVSGWGRGEDMVLFVCAQTGQWTRALRMLRRRVAEGGAQPSAEEVGSVVDACARCGKLREAVQLATKEATPGPDRDKAMGLVVARMSKAGHAQDAVSLAIALAEAEVGMIAVGWKSALHVCRQDWPTTQRLLRLFLAQGVCGMEELGAMELGINLVTGIEAGRLEEVEKLLDEMGWPIATVALNHLLKTASMKVQAARVLELFRRAKAAGVAVDVVSMTTVLHAYAKDGDWETALLMLEKMEGMSPDMQPNLMTYSAAIRACGIEKRWKEALAVFERMQAKGLSPDVMLYNLVINACAQAGQVEAVVKLLRRMEEAGLQPDLVTYTGAIRACERSGRWEEGMWYLEQMKEQAGIRPDLRAYNIVLSAVCKAGRWGEAKELLSGMQELGYAADDFTFQAVAAGPGNGTRRKEEVVEVLKRMGVAAAAGAPRGDWRGPGGSRKGRRKVGEGQGGGGSPGRR